VQFTQEISIVMKIHNRRGGFTLIELMIVVAIIGILAAIAIPNFLRFQLKAKSSEGKTNLSAIRTAEESFFAEFNRYVSADASPAAIGDNVKVDFVDQGPAGAGFGTLGWAPEGQVYFNYAVEVPAAGNEFTATAAANIDANGNAQLWGYRKGANAGRSHGTTPANCTAGFGVEATVEPCDATSGNSVF
jgi:type IV pilus assembly protein PilA